MEARLAEVGKEVGLADVVGGVKLAHGSIVSAELDGMDRQGWPSVRKNTLHSGSGLQGRWSSSNIGLQYGRFPPEVVWVARLDEVMAEVPLVKGAVVNVELRGQGLQGKRSST